MQTNTFVFSFKINNFQFLISKHFSFINTNFNNQLVAQHILFVNQCSNTFQP
jgi:hypothetical protein